MTPTLLLVSIVLGTTLGCAILYGTTKAAVRDGYLEALRKLNQERNPIQHRAPPAAATAIIWILGLAVLAAAVMLGLRNL